MKLKLSNFFSYILNFYKNELKNSIIFKINNKKIKINTSSINYVRIEIRDIEIAVINHYLEKTNLNESYKNHLFNQLFMINPEIYKKACLINYLINSDKKKIKFISASFMKKKDNELFKKFNITFREIKSQKINLLIVSIVRLLIEKKRDYNNSKKIYNEKYSKINSNLKYSKIIKDWNKDAQDFHVQKDKKSLDNAIIYLKPDIKKLLKSKKRIKYLRYLRNGNQDYFEYSPNINFSYVYKQALSIYFSSLPNEIKIGLINIIIQRISLDDFIEYIQKKFPDIKEFYTKEEYFTGTTYLTEKLKNEKIKTINYAHGVGSYCPIVNYDEFYVFSKAQANYYLSSSKFKVYEVAPSKKKEKTNLNTKLALFFICQNLLSHASSPTIKSSYKDVIKFIEQLAVDYDIPIFAKYHPASKESDKILSKSIIIVDDTKDLPEDNYYLALTFGSTYSMDLLGDMPFLLVNPTDFYLKYTFPNEDFILAKSYQELKKKIKKLITDREYYYQYWDKLISVIVQNTSP